MKEYIEIKFNNLDINKFSKMCREFLEHAEDGKVNIEHLREIYRKDRIGFSNLVQELSLRGCKFVTERNNNLLPQIDFSQDKGIIFVEKNKEIFKNIDFDKYKMANFTNKFQVESDSFFLGIFIEGFKVLGLDINLDDLKNDIEKVGFEIYNTNQFEEKIKKLVDKDEQIKEEENIEQDKKNNRLLVESIFNHTKYVAFLAFCRDENILYIDEITNETIQKFAKTKWIGVGKVAAVKEVMSQYIDIQDEEDYFVDIDCSRSKSLVAEVYTNPKYVSFLRFCDNHKIAYINELNSSLLKSYSEIQGVGAKKVEQVIKTLTLHIEESKVDEDKEINLRKEWYDRLANIKLVDVNTILENRFIIDTDFRVKDVHGKKVQELNTNASEIYSLIETVNNIYTPYEFMSRVEEESNLNNNEKICTNLRYNNAYSLEEVAKNNQLNITRERVRQIIKKAGLKVQGYAKGKMFVSSIKLCTFNDRYCTLKEIYNLLNHDYNNAYLMLLMNEAGILFKSTLFELVYFNENKEEGNINKIFNTLPNLFNIEDEVDQIIDEINKIGIQDIDIKDIENLLIKNNWNNYGKYFSKTRLTGLDQVRIIFENFIEEPLYYEESSFEHIRKLIKQEFGEEITTSLRGFERTIRDNEPIMLVDARTYLHIDKLELKEGSSQFVENILNKEFESNDVVNSTYIFNEYKKQLQSYGITNKYILYSIVGKYLSDEFHTGKGNTLDISKCSESLSMSREETLLKVIDDHKGKFDKKELAELLNWNLFTVEITVAKSNKLIMMGNSIATIKSLNATPSILKKIEDILDTQLIKGYTTSYDVINEMRLDVELYDFLENNKIFDGHVMSNFLKTTFTKLRKKRGNFITYKDYKYDCIEDVIKEKFSDEVFTRNDIKEFIMGHGYGELTYGIKFNSLVDNKEFIQIDELEFIANDKFHIEKEVSDAVVNYIEEQMGDKEYISLNTLSGYKRKLPRIDYRWNIHLIASILRDNGYKKIERTFTDPVTERVLITRENNEINTFEELAYKVIKEQYSGPMHEVKIYEFMSELGLVKPHEFLEDKKLPYDLIKGNRFKVDEVGRVEIF